MCTRYTKYTYDIIYTHLRHGRREQAHAEAAAPEMHVQSCEGGLDFPFRLRLVGGADEVGTLSPSHKKTPKNNRTRTERLTLIGDCQQHQHKRQKTYRTLQYYTLVNFTYIIVRRSNTMVLDTITASCKGVSEKCMDVGAG